MLWGRALQSLRGCDKYFYTTKKTTLAIPVRDGAFSIGLSVNWFVRHGTSPAGHRSLAFSGAVAPQQSRTAITIAQAGKVFQLSPMVGFFDHTIQ